MFLLNQDHEATPTITMLENGLRLNTRANIVCDNPVYLITYKYSPSKGILNTYTALLSELNDLIELKDSNEVEILSTYLLSNDKLNNSGQWLLDPLKEISLGYTQISENVATIYHTNNGTEYIERPEDTANQSIGNIVSIFNSDLDATEKPSS